MNRVLVLGAGLVSRPLVHYLTDMEGIDLTLADLEEDLEQLISDNDIVVSLWSSDRQIRVAEKCIELGRHLVTPSNLDGDVDEMSGRAASAGLTFLHGCGASPGIDHMSAMRVIHGATSSGRKLASFRSYFGVLPAPEANDNPVGHKFHWSPREVLLADTGPARYLLDGENMEVTGEDLLSSPTKIEIPGAGALEGYPYGDAITWAETSGLAEARTLFFGTLRNAGHCDTFRHWVKLGLFDEGPRSDLVWLTYKRFMQGFVDGAANLRPALAAKLDLPPNHPAIDNLDWLGLFNESAVNMQVGGNVDIVASRMLERCPFKSGERDMTVLRQEFVFEGSDAPGPSVATMVDFGIPGGDSSSARTTSLPAAIGTRMIVEGKITQRGVISPTSPEIYDPILDELATLGIKVEEQAEA